MLRLAKFSFIAVIALGCNQRSAKFDPVVQEIHSGVIAVPTNGIVQLPQRFAGLTPRDEVYAEKKPDGRLLILFPDWYGRGSDVEGWLYCSGPLQASDYYTIDWGAGGKQQHRRRERDALHPALEGALRHPNRPEGKDRRDIVVAHTLFT